MAVDIAQVEGCYVSSSLPKALFVSAFSKGHHSFPKRQHGDREGNLKQSVGNVLYFKPRTKAWGAEHCDFECAPVGGREHLAVQTDLYLEELCGVIDEADAQCETDPFLDRPTSPLFVPAKSGLDAETQIWPGELFDFDEEVEPVLEALIGQTLEQAVTEIMAEEELAMLMDMQNDFEARRNAEVAELKRLEEKERRIFEEKRKRLKEQEEAVKLENEVAEKIAACVFAQNYLSELIPQVYKKLEVQGYFETEDSDVKEMEENVWPWLVNEVDREIASLEASCVLLDSLISDSVQDISETSFIKAVAPDVYPERELEIELDVEPEEEEEEENGEESEESEHSNEATE